MDSSAVLVQTASGLERLMKGAGGDNVKDSTVAQISAAIYYKANVVARLTTSKGFQNKFHSVIFKQIQKDFGEYVDSQARMKPQSLHHVYEWNNVGVESARLFSLKKIGNEGLTFRIAYDFKPSKSAVPTNYGKARHVFANKALVMEDGFPVRIAPRHAERLVFEMHGSMVFMPKGESVVVRNPGGKSARNQFSLAYSRFFSGQLVNLSIKKSGFQNLFKTDLGKALEVPYEVRSVRYSFSPNSLRLQAVTAIETAFGGN